MPNSSGMNKSSLILVLFLLLSQAIFAQHKKDSTRLHQAVLMLNKALVQKDEQVLNRMLHRHLTYGHSNGWIERKKELIDNLYNGKLTYANIEQTQINIAIDKKVAVVRSKGNFDVIMGEQLLHFKLNILQVWLRKRGKWMLMSRQSVKMNE